MGFWDFLVWLLWAYVFFAYLMVLFSIFADIFRDRDLHGGWKAVWIVFLIFVPILAALVYLIARGSGMAARSAAHMARAQQDADSYIRSVAGGSASDEIAKASELLAAGSITADEYQALKAKALA